MSADAAVAAAAPPEAVAPATVPSILSQLEAGWRSYTARQLKPRVQDTYMANVTRFQAFLDGKPLHEASEPDLWRFIDHQLEVCGNLRYSALPRYQGFHCEKKLFPRSPSVPVSCAATCPMYAPRNPLVVHHALKALNSFYRFLVRRGYAQLNFVPDVLREFGRDHKPEKSMRPRRRLKVDEVRQLITGTLHPTRKAVYAVLAKTGFRIHEAVRLTVDPQCLDFGARTIRIPEPQSRAEPNKRRGKRFGFIDSELEAILKAALHYRAGLMARRPPDRQPRRLFLGDNGRPITEKLVDTQWLREDALRVGLVGEAPQKEERVTAHCFRHFFTTALVQRKCSELMVLYLRGDRVKNMIGTYYDPTEEELRTAYLEHYPVLGL